MKYTVSNFQDYRGGGWQWDVEIEGCQPRHCRTNGNGEGLWENGQQALGTTQYRLPASRKAARAKVVRSYRSL